MRQHVTRSFIALLCVSALVALHVAVPSDRAPRDRLARRAASPSQTSPTSTAVAAVASEPSPTPPLCVVVPYRERPGRTAREPERFAAYIRRWLKRVKGITRVRVWVLEQEDEHRFNRGFLINVGVALGRLVDGCDVFALHDVDLLPVDPRVPYAFDEKSFPRERGPVHLSPPGVHPEYCYPTFRGGAWLFAWKHLSRVNGYSHAYWGWGQEDDDLGARMRDANVTHANAFVYPGPRREEDGEKTRSSSSSPCTGRVQNCRPSDHDPTVRDCGVYPYDTFVRTMFHPTPGGVIEGIVTPPSRSLAEGTCFVHAHEGGEFILIFVWAIRLTWFFCLQGSRATRWSVPAPAWSPGRRRSSSLAGGGPTSSTARSGGTRARGSRGSFRGGAGNRSGDLRVPSRVFPAAGSFAT